MFIRQKPDIWELKEDILSLPGIFSKWKSPHQELAYKVLDISGICKCSDFFLFIFMKVAAVRESLNDAAITAGVEEWSIANDLKLMYFCKTANFTTFSACHLPSKAITAKMPIISIEETIQGFKNNSEYYVFSLVSLILQSDKNVTLKIGIEYNLDVCSRALTWSTLERSRVVFSSNCWQIIFYVTPLITLS